MFPPNGTRGGPEWTLTYASTTGSDNISLIAGASAGGVLLLVVIGLLILIIPLVFYLRRQAKQQDMRVTHLLSQMESMELDMADQCKQGKTDTYTYMYIHVHTHTYMYIHALCVDTCISLLAFAELQTDLGELVAEDSLDMQQLPFHDFPTYATKVFFPAANTNHPVLSPPKVTDAACTCMIEF